MAKTASIHQGNSNDRKATLVATTKAYGECRSGSSHSTVQGSGSPNVTVVAITKAYGKCRGGSSNDNNDQGKKRARWNNDIAVRAWSTNSQRDCPRFGTDRDPLRTLDSAAVSNRSNVAGERTSGTTNHSIFDNKKPLHCQHQELNWQQPLE